MVTWSHCRDRIVACPALKNTNAKSGGSSTNLLYNHDFFFQKKLCRLGPSIFSGNKNVFRIFLQKNSQGTGFYQTVEFLRLETILPFLNLLKVNMPLPVCTVHSAYLKKVKLLKKDLSPLTSHSDQNGLNCLHIILGLR